MRLQDLAEVQWPHLLAKMARVNKVTIDRVLRGKIPLKSSAGMKLAEALPKYNSFMENFNKSEFERNRFDG